MAVVLSPTLSLKPRNPQIHSPTFTSQHKNTTQTVPKHSLLAVHTRRRSLFTVTFLVFSRKPFYDVEPAMAFDFRMTVPDQTVEEAESAIRGHAQRLIEVKGLFESSNTPESLKEAQKALRKSSSYLKQDIYTLIQGKPGIDRPLLRRLYSSLFNGVTAMDYAARDKDVPRIWDSYGKIISALSEILSKI